MAKGKAVNNKQEAMGPPMTRGSRKRGYPVEKVTENDHQDMGISNTEDTLVQCLKSPEEEGDKKCIEPLESASSSDRNTYEKNEDSETPEMPPAGPKRQLVISLLACGDESNKKKIEKQKQVPNECDPLDDSNKYVNVNAGMKPNGSEEQMSAVDNHHKMVTNQELDEVKPISIEPVVEGLAKKRRRMGMCRLTENQLKLFLPKCGNRAEKSERRHENTVEVEEERGSSVEVLSPQQQVTEMMSHHNNREETKVETSANGTTMMCEPLSTEMHVSEDDPKGGLHSELITKHHTHVEEGLQRTEPESQMTVVADGAVPVCESVLNVCKSENTKDSDQLGNHHCAKLTRGIIESQDETLNNLCKDQTEPDFIQASDQRPEMEHQQNKTKTEAHTTVSICDASSPDLQNWERAQKPHLDKEQQSETEVHLTAKIADSECALQNPELQTTKVHLAGPPEPAALLNEEKQMSEQEESQKATFSKIHKQCENKYADGDYNHCENYNVKMNPTEGAPIEKEPPHQPDTYKISIKNLPQIIVENPYLIHTLVSDTTEQNCSAMENSHMMNSNCEEYKLHDANSSTVNMGPPEWREYVSDSQLNTIDMTHPVMDGGSEVPPECYEDVTDLVGGLIRELSFLNRTVMATHRELETLRRRSKNSRNNH